MSDILRFAGLTGLVVGLIAAMKGSLPKLHLSSRKQAGALIVAGFVLMMAGGAFADPRSDDSDPVPPPPVESPAAPAPTPEPELALAPPAEPSAPPPVEQSVGSVAGSTAAKQPAAAQAKTPAKNVRLEADQATGTGCDSHYPDFCIAPGPPDLDCPEVGRNNFTVLQPDPHRFDADHDGLGCDKSVPAQSGAPGLAPAPNIPPPAPADTECSDGVDNDGDGSTDGADPGCESLGDDGEENPAPPPSSPSAPPPPVPTPGDVCDPSYPGVCIAPAPPDLDCPQVPYSDFVVVGSDPHGFDADNDGVGCES